MLQPWKSDSSYYKYLVEHPPKGIDYICSGKKVGAITDARRFRALNRIKKLVRKALLGMRVPSPNICMAAPKKEADIVHCAHCVTPGKTPWVADFEGAWQFWISGRPDRISNSIIRRIILRDSCKRIIAWSEETRRQMEKTLPEISGKVEVLYPSVPAQSFRKRMNRKPVVLFVARYFWLKGGLIALETLRRMRKRREFEAIFVSDAPEEIKERYPEFTFLDLMPQKKLSKYYKKADIFLYPCFADTFGFALLEAMSFGIPAVTIDTCWTATRKEIVDNKTGFLISLPGGIDVRNEIDLRRINKKAEKIIAALTGKLEILMGDRKLREKMSKNCMNEIRNGKFSMKRRNARLREIYEEALK